MDRKEISDGIYASDQPSEPELRTLLDEGIRSIINLRTGETAQALSPSEEARVAEEAGLEYLNLPMRTANARPSDLDRLRENLASLPHPVLVHCRDGRRSVAMALAVQAPDRGWNGTRAVERARELGVDLQGTEMEEMVRTYADARRGTTSESRTAATEPHEPRSGRPRGGEPPRTQTK